MKKIFITITLIISAFLSFCFAEENKYTIEVKDYVIDKKLYRYIIVFENNDLLFIKNCDGKIKILNSQEQEHCNKNRKTL